MARFGQKDQLAAELVSVTPPSKPKATAAQLKLALFLDGVDDGLRTDRVQVSDHDFGPIKPKHSCEKHVPSDERFRRCKRLAHPFLAKVCAVSFPIPLAAPG